MKVPLKGGAGDQFKYVEPAIGPTFASRLHRIVAELVVSGARQRQPDRAAHAARAAR